MKKVPSPKVASTPAEKAIAAFGGAKALAEAIDRNVTRIHRWTYPASRGGTGGKIPGSALHDVLDAAKKLGLDLSADDLLGTQRAA